MASSISKTLVALVVTAAVAVALDGSARAQLEPAASTPPATQAQPSEAARAAARAKLVEGVGLLRQGEYARALARFEEAYALVPSPNIHYDIGLAYLGLGRDIDALYAFDAFLGGAGHAPAGKREKAEGLRARLRAKVATLEITSDQDGAEVAVDGRSYGATPLAKPIYVDPGWREIVVRKTATGAVAVERIEAAAGATLALSLRLTAPAPSVAASGAVRAAEQPGATSLPPAAVPARENNGAPPAHAGGRGAIWAASVAGLGAVLLGAGVTFSVLAKRNSDSLSEDSLVGKPPSTDHPVFNMGTETNGLRDQKLAYIFLSAGAVAVAGGAVIWAITRRRSGGPATETAAAPHVPRPAPTLSPQVSPSAAGVRLELSF